MFPTVRVQIAGSAAEDSDPRILEAMRLFVGHLSSELLNSGHGLVVGFGDEPLSQSGSPLTLDWAVLEAIAQTPIQADESTEPRFLAIGSQRGLERIPERRRETWDRVTSRTDFELVTSAPGWRMGGVIREAQVRRGDVLVVVGGGAGVEHLAELYRRDGKAVVPINTDVESFSGDGSGGSRRLHAIGMSGEGEFFRLRDGSGGTVARLNALRLSSTTDPLALALVTAALISDLRPPTAFHVRLLDDAHESYPAVERFFRETVDPAVVRLGFASHEVGQHAPLADFLNVEIFRGIHTAGLVVVDLTAVRPNCLMELGYAIGRGRRVVLSAKKGTPLPFDSDKLRVFFWDDNDRPDQLQRYVDWCCRFIAAPSLVG